MEMDETRTEESSERSSESSATRKKNGRNGRGRNGKQNGNGNGAARRDRDTEREVAVLAPDGKIREVDLRRVLNAMRDLRDGDFEVRLPLSEDPLLAEIADAFNSVAKLNERLCEEMMRVAATIGRQGQMNDRASIGSITGGW